MSFLLGDKLQLLSLVLQRAYRVGQRQDERHRTVVESFSRYCDRSCDEKNEELRLTNHQRLLVCCITGCEKIPMHPDKNREQDLRKKFLSSEILIKKIIVKERINDEDVGRNGLFLSEGQLM